MVGIQHMSEQNGHKPELNGNVPLLGGNKTQRVKVGAPVKSFVRQLEPEGTFEADGVVQMVNLGGGNLRRNVKAMHARNQYMSGEELVAETLITLADLGAETRALQTMPVPAGGGSK